MRTEEKKNKFNVNAKLIRHFHRAQTHFAVASRRCCR